AERYLLAGGGRLLRAVGPAAVRGARLLCDAGAAHHRARAAPRVGRARRAAPAGAGDRPLSLEGAGGALLERCPPRRRRPVRPLGAGRAAPRPAGVSGGKPAPLRAPAPV